LLNASVNSVHTQIKNAVTHGLVSTTLKNGILAGIVAIMGWGMAGALVKNLSGLDPILLSSLRGAVSFIILELFLILRSGARKSLQAYLRISTSEFYCSVLLAVAYVLIVIAYQKAPVAEVAFLNSLSPIWIICYTTFKTRKIKSMEFLGILTSLGGAILLVDLEKLIVLNGNSQPFGLFAALISSIAMTAFIISVRLNGTTKINTLTTTRVAFLLLSLIMLPLLFTDHESLRESVFFDTRTFALILTLGLVATCIPTISFAKSTALLPSLFSSCLRNVTPFIAIIMDYFINGNKVRQISILGGILVFISLFLIHKGTVRKRT
jgi:drug/metabolite transporter (DMT)-like permease